jgi:hypothetical protein
MHPVRPNFLLVLAFAALLPALPHPLGAAEKKKTAGAADTWVSPNGLYRVHLDKHPSASGLTEVDVTLFDAKSGASLLEMEGPGATWADSTRILWASDSQRFVYVTETRRGDWCDYVVHRGEKWENAPWPVMPELQYHGRTQPAKTVLAAWKPVRWLKPNVFLVDNQIEDDAGHSAQMRIALTFDADNHITARKAEK